MPTKFAATNGEHNVLEGTLFTTYHVLQAIVMHEEDVSRASPTPRPTLKERSRDARRCNFKETTWTHARARTTDAARAENAQPL